MILSSLRKLTFLCSLPNESGTMMLFTTHERTFYIPEESEIKVQTQEARNQSISTYFLYSFTQIHDKSAGK